MNIVLWILQGILAFLFISGGAFKVIKVEDLRGHFRGFPDNGWRAIGLIEVLGAVALVLPARWTGQPLLTHYAAALLALESGALSVAYARKSLKLVAANPLVFAAPMAIVAAVVAYGRYALHVPA